MKHLLVIFLGGLVTATSWAQPDSLHRPTWQLSGYLETFYAYDFNRPGGVSRQDFLFNHNRHHEVNLNLGLIRLSVEDMRYRGAFALQTGTYAADNYAQEPEMLQFIHEAYAGLALNTGSTLWLDMGIFGSHIGFESAIGADNLTLTRSLLAENSPYFLSGARLTWAPSPNWELEALVLNGWQRIQRLPGNSMLSMGTRATYSPRAGITLNWSTFIGTDDPDPTRRMRYFNNLYGQFSIGERWQLIAGIDTGWQQQEKGGSRFHRWMSPVAIVRYQWTDHWAMAGRVEWYDDPHLVIMPGENAFRTGGLTGSLDYSPVPGLVWRMEGRWLLASRPIFDRAGAGVHDNFVMATSVCLKF
jgi:hypothetical protein